MRSFSPTTPRACKSCALNPHVRSHPFHPCAHPPPCAPTLCAANTPLPTPPLPPPHPCICPVVAGHSQEGCYSYEYQSRQHRFRKGSAREEEDGLRPTRRDVGEGGSGACSGFSAAGHTRSRKAATKIPSSEGSSKPRRLSGFPGGLCGVRGHRGWRPRSSSRSSPRPPSAFLFADHSAWASSARRAPSTHARAWSRSRSRPSSSPSQ